jgi:hypothetical protein
MCIGSVVLLYSLSHSIIILIIIVNKLNKNKFKVCYSCNEMAKSSCIVAIVAKR